MHGALISDLQSQLELKSNDRALGHVFERLSTSVSRELGDRHTKFQLDDPNFVADEQGTADSKYFKAQVDHFYDKLEIISLAILKQDKAKKQITGRIQKLEDCFKEFVSLTQFREEMIGFEGQFKESIRSKLSEFE